MCRWIAYSGSPILLDTLLYKPKHSLIDQSLHARLGPHTTNGDGFGIGWYEGETPALYKNVDPVWNDRNLRELSGHIRSGLMFAHIRASTGTPVQYTNCHPFRHDNWLWMHNGQIAGFSKIKRELALAIDPHLYPFIEGSSDTEFFFFLALSLGLHEDTVGAVEHAVGLIEQLCLKHEIEDAVRMSVATTDGTTIWAFRYSTTGDPPSLFYSTDIDTIRMQHPELKALKSLSKETRLVVSEPLGDLKGVWNEVPPSSYGAIKARRDSMGPFLPKRE